MRRHDVTTPHRYTATAISLHWIIAALILIAIGMGWYMVDLPQGQDRAWFFRHHKNVGLTVALLVLFRIWWRVRHPAPSLPVDTPRWEQLGAHYSHRLLYALMVLMPITGFLTTSFTGFPTYYLGIPVDLGAWGGENKLLNSIFAAIHTFLAYFLLALIVLHALAALRHLLIKRDGIFQRMLPSRGPRNEP